MKEPLYLVYESSNAIPVPSEYWTIIYDPSVDEAISFLGNNNPHSKDIQSYNCKNICHDIEWVKDELDEFEEETEGHVSCCSVKSLQKHISYIMDLKANNGRNVIESSLMKDIKVTEHFQL